MLATQLAGHGRVVDYRAADSLRIELLSHDAVEWAWWRAHFEPRLEALHEGLRAAATLPPVA